MQHAGMTGHQNENNRHPVNYFNLLFHSTSDTLKYKQHKMLLHYLLVVCICVVLLIRQTAHDCAPL